MIKRIFDIIFSFVGIIITLPIWFLIAIMIKRDSKGSVFYKAKRVGKEDKDFLMYKFRTMIEGADKMGGACTAGDDIRLTKIGKILKRFQLDELPQLINVLKGDMSIVGPRPEVRFYVDIMSDKERDIILSVLPGMTDYASLWNFHEGDTLKGAEDPEKEYMEKIRPKKIKLQIKYVEERSLFVDIKIIFKTIIKVFKEFYEN